MGKVSIPKLHSIKLKGHDNVVGIPILTNQDNDPQKVLLAAVNHRLTEVVIAGREEDGTEYFAASKGDQPSVLWLISRMNKMLLSLEDE